MLSPLFCVPMVSKDLFYISIFFEEDNKNIQKELAEDITHLRNPGYNDLKDLDKSIEDSNKSSETSEEFDYTELDMSHEIWEEIDDLEDAIIFMDLGRDQSVSYNRVTASELGGFIHIRCEIGKRIYSYNVKTNTISLFSIPYPMLPTSHVLLLEDDHGEAKCITDSKVEMLKSNDISLRPGIHDGVECNESHLLSILFNHLEMIIELYAGVEYMNFRATCKQCLLSAPLIRWSNETSIKRLQKYSLVSPLLMVVDKKQDIITFTDPMWVTTIL
ncbi:hypothetical protein Tco_0838318 [Tanacetum coccineum]|uniref:Uncharacterized protein n=1 Tax=Tanacetum coccineum TaxID=301880 RepID=A0ABQ5ARC5_9ASTR